MKRFQYFLLIAALLIFASGCAAETPVPEAPAAQSSPATQPVALPTEAAPEETAPEAAESTNTLVAYFSCTGNTQVLAEAAAEYLHADLYRIEAKIPYTAEDIAYYTGCRADEEQDDPSARPEIAGQVENMAQYDTIVLGYPIWHGQAPRIISTFLESYDLAGKTVIPFCTSQSSGIGSSDTNLHSLCQAQWTDGRRFPADADISEFTAWLDEVTPENTTIANEDDAMERKLTLKINDTIIPVTWEENASAAELAEYAAGEAVSIAMQMYGGWEQVGPLGRTFTRSDVQLTAQCGDIMLYSGDQIVLFYGENSWAYTKLGHIDLSESEVSELLGNGDITVTLTVQ